LARGAAAAAAAACTTPSGGARRGGWWRRAVVAVLRVAECATLLHFAMFFFLYLHSFFCQVVLTVYRSFFFISVENLRLVLSWLWLGVWSPRPDVFDEVFLELVVLGLAGHPATCRL